MKARASYLLRYLLFWMIYFTISRLCFMLYQFRLSLGLTMHDWVQILLRGGWMDLSLSGYILMLSALLIAFLFFCPTKNLSYIFKSLTIILLTLFSIIIVADFELYRNWLFRIDATPLLYLKNPREALASTPVWLITILIIIIIAFTYLFYLFYNKLCNRVLQRIKPGKWPILPVFIFLSACMILPIRGGLGIAPMNPSKVFFGTNVYANHAALNAPWNLFYALRKSGDMNRRFPDAVDAPVAQSEFETLMACNADSTRLVLNNPRPNIVLILLESFTAKAIGSQGGMKGITPCLDSLSTQGINFTGMYAAADRSDKGIVAVLSGFPAQPLSSVIKYPSKSAKLPSISKTLANQGYNTTFYYGGDPTFASISAFLFGQQFTKIVAQDEFPANLRNSKWGVHDQYMFDRLLTDLDTAQTPFFKMLFTLTSHEPYETPTTPTIPGTSDENRFLNSMCYTDSCLGHFFDEAKKQPYYQNTLFVIVADHGHRFPNNTANHLPTKFRIPMLWLGGALKCKPFTTTKIGSQIDIPATILTQLQLNCSQFTFSKDILNPTSKQFAFYAFNNGYGFVTQDDTTVRDQTTEKYLISTKTPPKPDAAAFYRIYQDHFLDL